MTTYLKKQEVEFKDPSTGEVLSVLEELETPGTEYLNITLKDDEGWKLDVYENGFVEFYELNYDTRVVGRNITHERVIQMWRMMQEGKRDQVKKLLKKSPILTSPLGRHSVNSTPVAIARAYRPSASWRLCFTPPHP